MLLNEIITAPRFRNGLHVWLDEDNIVQITDLPQDMTDKQFIEAMYKAHEKNRRYPAQNAPAHHFEPTMRRDYEQAWKREIEDIKNWLTDRINHPPNSITVSDKDLRDYWVRHEFANAKPITLAQYISHITDPEHQRGYKDEY